MPKNQPGQEHQMRLRPQSKRPASYRFNRLEGKVAIITGGDSGIGKAVAIAFAQEGADIAILYLNEHKDAQETKQLIEKENRRCILISGDIGEERHCREATKRVLKAFGKIDILVNNVAEQHPTESILDISSKQLEKTFRTNVFSYFYMVKAVLPHLEKGACIINTASVVAYRGSHHLLDYSATKGAIVAFTRSLSENLIKKGIRVNGVAPGPIWTPLIMATFTPSKIKKFGKDTPMKRPGEPEEVAPAYVFLASEDASYMSGQVLHPNGGEIING